MRILAFLLLFAVSQNACRHSKPGSPHFGKNPDLYGLRFSLIRMDGAAIKAPPGLIHITFESDDNKMSGGAGCNSYAGMWTVHDDMMKLLPLQVTEMVCTEHMQLEQRYLAVLRETEHYSLEVKREGEIKIHTLTLSAQGRELAAFRSEENRK
ncbi:MAG: META domain-containing protein [Bacteroidota bacterium]